MKSIRILAFAVIGLLVSTGVGMATPSLQWSIVSPVSPSSWLGDANGAPLTGSSTISTVGYFMQLIWAGTDGLIDPINLANLDAHGGGDVVVATGFVGYGTGLGTVNGYFNSGTIPGVGRAGNVSSYTAGVDLFYIRTWDAAVNSTNAFNSGFAPIGANGTATYYGDSSLHLLTTNAVVDSWQLASGFNTVNPVPEPTTFALMGIGLALVVLRRRV